MRRLYLMGAAGALAVLVAGLGGWLLWSKAAGADIGGQARQFDLLAMLREVHDTNTAIVRANDALLESLEGVRQEAGAVTGVHGRLKELEGGLKEQRQALGRLERLTAEQAALSRQLQQMTAQVGVSTRSLAETASEQAAAVEGMSRSAASLSVRMGEIGSANRSTADKLRRAEQLSATVLTRMP